LCGGCTVGGNLSIQRLKLDKYKRSKRIKNEQRIRIISMKLQHSMITFFKNERSAKRSALLTL